MKKHFWFTLLSLIALCSSACAYPVYRIGMNFQGIDKSAASRMGQKYVYQGNVGVDVLGDNYSDEHRNDNLLKQKYTIKATYDDFKYVRLEGPDGKTLWKTSELVTHFPEDYEQETIPILKKGEETTFSEYYAGDIDGVLLQDSKTKQRVFKKTDGTEMRLPLLVSDYELFLDAKEFTNRWLFLKLGIGRNLEIAVVNVNGTLEWQYTSNYLIDGVSDIWVNESHDRIFIKCNENYSTRTLLLSGDGKLVKFYSINVRSSFSSLNPKIPDHAILDKGASEKFVVNIRNGDIIAEAGCSDIDMTQVNNSLIAAISYGPFIATIDVLTGDLIQDFTPKSVTPNETYDITQVKISQDAKDVWFREKRSKTESVVKHYKAEE